MAQDREQSIADQIKITKVPKPSAGLIESIKIIPQETPRPLEIKIGDEIELDLRISDKEGRPETINTDIEDREVKQGVAALLAMIAASMVTESAEMQKILDKFAPTPIMLELEEDKKTIKIDSGDLVMEIGPKDLRKAAKPDIEIRPEDISRADEPINISAEELQPSQSITITEEEIHEAVTNGVLPAGNLREGLERALTRLANLGQGSKTFQDIFKLQ